MAQRLSLNDAVTRLGGVGPKVAEHLERLRVRCIGDLLFHLPLRYQDRTRLVPIGALRLNQEILVEGTIDVAQVVFGRRRALVCRLSDGSGAITLRFFYFNQSQQQRLQAGRRVRCFGEVRRGAKSFEMIHPECQIVDPDNPSAVDAELTPIYPTTEGLHQARLRKMTDQALAILADEGLADREELVPATILQSLQLPTLTQALHYVHRPPPDCDVELLSESRHPSQRRLIFEELLAHQISLKQLRARAREFAAPQVVCKQLAASLKRNFGFELTGAQDRVVDEIAADLASGLPMLRLLQGDVGAGKTAVAAMVAARMLEAEFQVALMAPTELLAEQHAATLRQWFEPLGIDVILLTSRLSKPQRRPLLEQLASSAAVIAVGTHALFQNDVHYANLGLIIVDEQHRFGVDQRLALRDKGARSGFRPHQLIMTATPIPRTLAMTAYADLDVSILDQLPPQRKPVHTAVISDSRRPEIVQRIATAVDQGLQVYWVCPLIDESSLVESQAATETQEQLTSALPDLRVGLVHGRLNEREKDAAMQSFKSGETDLLVATTVIEVGVDVPNASLMVIENAERLGLSQLHQLRGRVGRGAQQAHCVLLYKAPLSRMAKLRLQVMRSSTDGFLIADRDLELRGPGELLGTRQAGAAQFRIADLSRDADLLGAIQETSERLLNEFPDAAGHLVQRWLAERVEYANV